MKKDKLIEHIELILWEDWNPIHISQSDSDNEYSSYSKSIYKKLINGTDQKGLSALLLKFEKTSLGLDGNAMRCERVSKKILELTK